MNLFLDDHPRHVRSFQKTAAFAARLSDDQTNWPQELTSELFKQLPFLSDYDVNVNLDRVEPQRGFAFGYADVANKTERPEQEHQEAGIPHVRIPLVVVERAVKPFSVFLNGEGVLPLTEERIREVLFNPQTFDLSTSQPKDPSLIETLSPPQRFGTQVGNYKTASAEEAFFAGLGLPVQMKKEAFYHISKPQWDALYQNPKIQELIKVTGNPGDPKVVNEVYMLAAKHYGFHPKDLGPNPLAAAKKVQEGKGPAGANGVHKPESKPAPKTDQKPAAAAPQGQKKTASLLRAIAPTIRESDAEAFTEKVANDANLVAGFRRSGITQTLVDVLENTKRASADERLLALAESIEPTVVTVQKLPGGDFLVKSANNNAFAPDQQAQGQVIPQQEAAEAIGQDNAQAMQPGQTATAVADPVEEQEPPQQQGAEEMPDEKVVDSFGQWQVQDAMGNKLVGHVFPRTLAWDGSFTPQPIALFTNGSAYAFQEAIAGELSGKSSVLPSDVPRGDGVFYSTDGGKGVATAPVTVHSAMSGPDGMPKYVGADVFGNPLSISHMEGLKTPQRIRDNEYALPESWKFMRLNGQTQLIPDPLQMNKQSAARDERTSVELIYNGAYHLRGGCGLDKLARDFRTDLDAVGAEFMLGLLGVDGARGKIKVAEARKKGQVKLAGLKTITTLAERFQQSEKTAAALLRKVPDLRKDLLKEAAALEDEGTVDHILALNFINPENLATFVGYLPELEQTSEKLAEMLLYSYLGMKEIPEGAVDRAMKNLEEVMVGLKAAANSGG